MMRNHWSEADQKDTNLGHPEIRTSTEKFRNEAQKKPGIATDSADFAYVDAAAGGQEAATRSSASSLRSLPPSQLQLGNRASDGSRAWTAAGIEPSTGHKSPATYETAGDNTDAARLDRPFPLSRRAETSVFRREPDLVDTAKAQFGLPPLNVDDPGVWLVNHHRDELVQKIGDDPASGLLPRFLDIGFAKNSKSQDEESVGEHRNVSQSGDPPRYRVSFAEMQRMHLRKLQIKLVKHAVYMYKDGREAANPTWENDLAEYIQGLKDYDYMTECSKHPQDFFLATGERNIDRYVINKVIRQTAGTAEELRAQKMQQTTRVEQVTNDSVPIGGTRGEKTRLQRAQDFWDRFLLAAIGAALLLGPMWLMVLHNTLYTGLVTTTVCVAVFGLVASWRLDKPNDVLSATAAYAAVLVVFVGLTNTD
ncbi:hypothetical protein FJTKL_04873 [Diaporthe vaccinii]|uniref:DUF6594 domain-containing protein n=1 Tax=Diaporthe vaccinii TaxID=105482 RepID=A0ABR4DS49_9PEZI